MNNIDNNSTPEIGDLKARMSGAEANIQAIGRDVQQLTDSINSYVKQTTLHIDSLSARTEENHKELRKSLIDSQKIPWAPVVGSAGLIVTVIITIIGFLTSAVVKENDRIQRDIDGLQTQIFTHMVINAKDDSSQNVKIEFLSQEVSKLLSDI